MNFSKSLFRAITLLVLIIFAATGVFAQSSSSDGQVLANKLAEHLALTHKLSEAPEDIRIQFEQNPLQLPAETNEQMLRHFDEAYESDLLLADFKSAFKEKVTSEYRPEISEWLNSENIQVITDSRQEFYTLQGKRKRVITMYEMDQDPPSEERKDLIETLSDTTSVAESTVESSVIILRSVITALSELSEQQTFSDSQVNAIANNFRSQIEPQIKKDLDNQTLVLFHNVEDNILENYISFWGTKTGKWLDQAISQGIQSAYKAGAERFLDSLKTDQ